MKLYMKPGACSLASHIILKEVNAVFETEQVDTEKGLTASGVNYHAINANGYVPALQLGEEEILTEGPSILQYLADTHPETGLAPVSGSLQRARMNSYLNYIGSELHKAFSPLFHSASSAEAKKAAIQNIGQKFDYIANLFADGRRHLLGDEFSVADAYLFVVVNWSNFVGIELANWPDLEAYQKRIASRPSAVSAMQAEGLL
ncbi:glutathione transferase GstA [Sneathiella limimaris]|uniref:glutathione transferase GstA n=1 Tax=Sneathiella limimaris TaxID=1964213 RepID=UPI00146E1405|nr:glutathione transferase GstA [Sneathiella limimaris]